jgi:ABC-type nitrate/sulfonate/bicarbonate transport system substrate-binding protein
MTRRSFRRISYEILRRPLAAGITLLCLLFAGCGKRGRPLSARRIRIGVQDNTFPALVLLAKERGLFSKHGLDAAVSRYPSGKLAYKALKEGEVDLSTASEMVAAKSALNHDDFRILAVIGTTDRGAWITARKDAGISSPSDLKGKTIATQSWSAVHFFLSRFLLVNRIDAQDVTTVFLPAVEMPGALREKRIDAFSMRNPFAKGARELLGDNAVEFFEKGAYLQHFVLIAETAFAENRVADIERLFAALAEAERFLKSRPEKSRKLVADALGDGRLNEVKKDWPLYRFGLNLGQSLLLTMEAEVRWLLAGGESRNDPPDFLEYLFPGPLLKTRPRAVTLAGAGER